RFHFAACAVELDFDPLRMLDQGFPIGSRPQAARMALEQGQPDIVFQLFQPLRQPWLRGIQDGRGVADIAGLGETEQHLEIAQPEPMSPVHASAPVYVKRYGSAEKFISMSISLS